MFCLYYILILNITTHLPADVHKHKVGNTYTGKNHGKILYFPKLSHFFSKWANYSPILRKKKWKILGNIQNFPKMFSRFFPV